MAPSALLLAAACFPALLAAAGAPRPEVGARYNASGRAAPEGDEESFRGKFDCTDHGPLLRLVGAKEARPGMAPSKMTLLVETGWGRRICGGVLVSRTQVLTSAQCLVGARSVQASPSYWHPSRWAEHAVQPYKSSTFCQPSEFANELGQPEDYALVHLDEHVPVNQETKVACLAREPPQLDQRLSVLSLGQVGGEFVGGRFRPREPQRMRAIRSKVRKCRAPDQGENHFCTTSHQDYLPGDTCDGDEGAGLYGEHQGLQLVYGLVSYSSQSCQEGRPGYTVAFQLSGRNKQIYDLALECHRKWLVKFDNRQ